MIIPCTLIDPQLHVWFSAVEDQGSIGIFSLVLAFPKHWPGKAPRQQSVGEFKVTYSLFS